MRVKVEQLIEGCILTKDVSSVSSKPLFPTKTVITIQVIEVLHAFLIQDVEVDSNLINGLPFTPSEVIDNNTAATSVENSSFYDLYMSTVKEYKKLFANWQAGMSVDMSKVRSLIVPLVDKSFEEPNQIMQLHRWSTRSDYFYHHSVSVSLIAALLGKKLQYEQGDYNQLAIAGFLSDCGMAKIDPKIAFKTGPLTSAEYKEIKNHPLLSYKMLEKLPLLKDSVKLAVFQHHERIDGTGYILGVSGDKLHPFGKIVAISDVYHAMCCDKDYRVKKPPFIVLEEIAQDSFGKFDVQLVKLLIQEAAKISIGTEVKLSNGQVAKVIFIDDKYPTRPMVDINGSFLQLTNRKDLYIESILL
ncbi:HD-GYP domain-containing protein [Litchfieldia salsa]|uniref:HD-GYP domain, c-di-GMP phosphodiesterase class II (Or its inactivated variant) n=1 Tax=Litchfieldia salsa TaxID=930152 RepID=A0A1H0UFV9_9BACI|nr:HD-GYP domain-containing protein [Litchfieldia salsa]SDP64878.1 HD-GYP domain, c-di-GMP phosphodiesterase class II (or its inactivated variant) [Litchfieldia salsa]